VGEGLVAVLKLLHYLSMVIPAGGLSVEAGASVSALPSTALLVRQLLQTAGAVAVVEAADIPTARLRPAVSAVPGALAISI